MALPSQLKIHDIIIPACVHSVVLPLSGSPFGLTWKKKRKKNPTLHLSWAACDLQLSFAFHAHLLTSGSRHTHCISLLQSLFYFHSQLFPTFSTLLKPSANSLFHLCAQATTFLLASCWSSRKCTSLDPGNINSHVHSVPASKGMSSSKANSYTLMLIPVSLTHMLRHHSNKFIFPSLTAFFFFFFYFLNGLRLYASKHNFIPSI